MLPSATQTNAANGFDDDNHLVLQTPKRTISAKHMKLGMPMPKRCRTTNAQICVGIIGWKGRRDCAA